MRRRRGVLLPVETEVLRCAAALEGDGVHEVHGYVLARHLRLLPGEARRLTANGTLYKALRRLEAAHLVSSRWEEDRRPAWRPPRRLYRVTPAGVRALAGHGDGPPRGGP